MSSSMLSAIWKSELEAGVPSDTLEILMGHVGKTVSAKYYTRPSKEMLVDTVANAFENMRISK